MSLAAAIVAALITQAAPNSPIQCIYQTIGAQQMQVYNNQIDEGALSIDQFADIARPAISSCIERGVWTQQHQIDASFSYSLALASYVEFSRRLEMGGIDPSAISRQWDVMPVALRTALMEGVGTYAGGRDLFIADMRTFLTSQTAAREAPHLGNALSLFVAMGEMRRKQEEHDSPGPSS
jgi:hypothetical protein